MRELERMTERLDLAMRRSRTSARCSIRTTRLPTSERTQLREQIDTVLTDEQRALP